MVKYVEHNKVRVKPGKREESTRPILGSFKKIQTKTNEMGVLS
jgi:hypothetical protein